MLELEFPAANLVNGVLLCIGDQMLRAEVICYQAKLAEIE